mmetsp:Transcript_23214/g.32801  ORF Transcript_23214/g.32801 Transcript_23214/m.32801 type:complete len:226 (+) Transcript_23214:689-1366(+)
MDVNPLSLGVEATGGVMATIIKRNSQIPQEKSQIFTTAVDNQDKIHIQVFQGEREFTKDNDLLDQFTLDDIPPASRGEPQIKVTFRVDADGTLRVYAKDMNSELSKEFEVKNRNLGGLSKDEIEKMIKDAEQHQAEDGAARKRVEARGKCESYMHKIKGAVAKDKNFEAKDRADIEKCISETLNWLSRPESQTAEASEFDTRQKQLFDVLKPILKRINDAKDKKK